MAENKKDHRLEDALAFAQDFLTPEKRAEFEAHLQECTACQATLERVKVFLPNLQLALTPKLRSSEELLAAAKAEARDRQLVRERRVASRRLGVRARVAVLAVATAAAGGTIFAIARPLFEMAETGAVPAPHRMDAGMDAGAIADGGEREDLGK